MRGRTKAALAALVLAPTVAAAQDVCPGGRPRSGDVGIRALACRHAEGCDIWLDGGTAGPRHRFSVEPRITRTATTGGSLREGDVLVSVDGVTVTTPEGGALLADLPLGREVPFVVRRGGEAIRVVATPVPGCGPTALTVTRR